MKRSSLHILVSDKYKNPYRRNFICSTCFAAQVHDTKHLQKNNWVYQNTETLCYFCRYICKTHCFRLIFGRIPLGVWEGIKNLPMVFYLHL